MTILRYTEFSDSPLFIEAALLLFNLKDLVGLFLRQTFLFKVCFYFKKIKMFLFLKLKFCLMN